MKIPPFELTSAARLDLLKLWNYLAEFASLDVADAVLSDVETAMLKLSKRSGIGHRREDLTPRELRFFLIHRHFIIYRPSTTPLKIIRVLHPAQNIKRLLRT